METGGSPAVAMKNTTLVPKSIIIQKFGNEANFEVEEVQPAENGCPGLAISQKGPCLYRCILQLPGIAVMSGTFKKKKDAEQSAAEMAIEKVLSISLSIIFPPLFLLFLWLANCIFIHCLNQLKKKICNLLCYLCSMPCSFSYLTNISLFILFSIIYLFICQSFFLLFQIRRALHRQAFKP
jgi:hypothetical protein